MRSRLTRRQVTASLALSGLWAVVRGAGVSAQEPAVSTVDERIKRLEQQLEELRRTLKIPGVAAAIVKDGKLLWAKGIGFADVENKIPAAPETNYRIASLTKPFASTLLMQLVDLAKYDAAIDGHTLVRAETQERAWTPASTPEGKKLPYGLGWFVQSHEGMRLVWHYGYWPESFSSLYVKLPERKMTLILLANSDGLSAPFFLGAGDVIRSPFANSFLRIFVREASLGRALPDPRWSQASDRFNAEIEQLAPQAGHYRYDAERGSHELLTRWLDDRRRAAPR